MENFMSAFEKNKAKELAKLSRLEEQIAERLEQISNNINGDIDSTIFMADELEMLNTLMDQNLKKNDEKSLEELKQDTSKLRQISRKLEALELKIKTETNESQEKIGTIESSAEAENLNTSEVFKNIHGEKRKDLFGQNEQTIEQAEENNADYNQMKEQIEQNEIYRSIFILEDKLARAGLENTSIWNPNEQVESSSLIERVLALTAQYNTYLINDLKTIY